MRKKCGCVFKSFWNPETGMWHVLVHEDEELESTAELLTGEPGLRPDDRVRCATGLRHSTRAWRPIEQTETAR